MLGLGITPVPGVRGVVSVVVVRVHTGKSEIFLIYPKYYFLEVIITVEVKY